MSLALSSGGLEGIPILVGAFNAFIRRKGEPYAIAGTSAGAIVAFWHAIGYRPVDMLRRFIQDVCEIDAVSYDEILNAYCHLGMFNVDNRVASFFEKYLEERFGTRDMTWNSFHRRTKCPITFIATNMNTASEAWFNVEHTPDVSVIQSLCASCSIPYLFQPVKIGQSIFIDGVFSNNLPISIYSHSYGIVIYMVDNKVPQTHQDLFMKIIRCLIASQTSKVSLKNTIPIYVKSGICSTFNFQNLSFSVQTEDVLSAFDNGFRQTKKWFKERNCL